MPAAAALMLASAACTSAAAEVLTAGQELFNRHCGNSHCHGSNGTGGGAPALAGRSLAPMRIADVLAQGIPGTRMPSFANELSADEASLLVAFLTGRTDRAAAVPLKTVETREARPTPQADATARGERLFFDLSREQRCSACHTYAGRGGTAAADLTEVAAWPLQKLLQAIADPAPAPGRAVSVVMRDGRVFQGLLQSEESEAVRIADVSTLPAVQRWLDKAAIASLKRLPAGDVPVHATPRLSARERDDVAAYLQSRDRRPQP